MTPGRSLYNKYQDKAEAFLFTDNINCRYLSGFDSTDGFVIVTKENVRLFVDSRYHEAACRAKSEKSLPEDVDICLMDNSLIDMLKRQFFGYAACAVSPEDITVSFFDKLKKSIQGTEFILVEGMCTGLRMIKSEKELENIKTAQDITDAAFSYILTRIKKGVTEKALAADIEYFIKTNGGDGSAFDTIVVSGSASSLPHGVPSDIPIAENSFITMDFGAKYRGYCSDMTRTVVLGRADPEMKHVYETVLKAQESALSAAVPGTACSRVDKTARDIIYSAGYEGYFGHSTGHSLGLEIHEKPSFSPNSSETTAPGMVMTVEPGIYLPDRYGVRIEDLVLITGTGNRIFTKSPKNLLEI